MDELPLPHKQMWREASWVYLVIHSLTQQRLTEWGLATSQEARGISSMREEALETWAGTERLHSQLLCTEDKLLPLQNSVSTPVKWVLIPQHL